MSVYIYIIYICNNYICTRAAWCIMTKATSCTNTVTMAGKDNYGFCTQIMVVLRARVLLVLFFWVGAIVPLADVFIHFDIVFFVGFTCFLLFFLLVFFCFFSLCFFSLFFQLYCQLFSSFASTWSTFSLSFVIFFPPASLFSFLLPFIIIFSVACGFVMLCQVPCSLFESWVRWFSSLAPRN